MKHLKMAIDNTRPAVASQDSIASFNADAAAQLAQAFHQRLELDSLLSLFARQAQALSGATGVRYEGADETLKRVVGITRKHHVRYNLQWPDTDLGSLTVFFDQPAPEHALRTTEDLIALMAGALKNAVAYELARSARSYTPGTAQINAEDGATARPSAADAERCVSRHLAAVPSSDSLILVALDCFAQMQAESGAEWAQAVLDSVQAVLSDALREADGVFQIREGLLAVLLPGTHAGAAEQVAQKICVHIGSLHLSSSRVGEQLTACMGVATSISGEQAADVLARAEQHLYRAQSSGPNAVYAGKSG